MDTVIHLSPEMVADIQEQIARHLKQQIGESVANAVASALHPEVAARAALQDEARREREDGDLRARAVNAAAPAVKAALMAEAARYGPISLRFTSVAAPAELQWIPVFPSHAFRR